MDENALGTSVTNIIVTFCKDIVKNPKVFRKCADIHYISYKRCIMSNFSIHTNYGDYSYNRSYLYMYLGKVPTSETKLKEAFSEFNVTPTGKVDDLKKLESRMYADYSNQVQQQIENQNNQQVCPWASLCAQIGVQATGNYEKDYAAFNNAINLLSQSAMDGQAMAFFAGLKSEAQTVFGFNKPEDQPKMTFEMYQAQFL